MGTIVLQVLFKANVVILGIIPTFIRYIEVLIRPQLSDKNYPFSGFKCVTSNCLTSPF